MAINTITDVELSKYVEKTVTNKSFLDLQIGDDLSNEELIFNQTKPVNINSAAGLIISISFQNNSVFGIRTFGSSPNWSAIIGYQSSTGEVITAYSGTGLESWLLDSVILEANSVITNISVYEGMRSMTLREANDLFTDFKLTDITLDNHVPTLKYGKPDTRLALKGNLLRPLYNGKEVPLLSEIYTKEQSDKLYAKLVDFQTHTRTDAGRWQDYYESEEMIYEMLAESQGAKPDEANQLDVSGDSSFTVNNELGGLVKATIYNTETGYSTLAVNSEERYNGEGITTKTAITKSFPVNNGDVVSWTNMQKVLYIPYMVDNDSMIIKLYTSSSNKISTLQQQFLTLQAAISSKVPDTANQVDIESQSTSGGYIVPDGIGGQVSGRGGNYLLAGTGVVYVNGEGNEAIYDNRGLPLAIGGAPLFYQDVKPADVITSNGMTELYYIPYIPAPAPTGAD